MRHAFVSLLSDSDIRSSTSPGLVGHRGGAITETVYRQEICPVMEEGATEMDRIFPCNGVA
jgi:hypothetical protein